MVLGRAKRQSRAHDEGLMIKFSEYIPIPSRICEDFEKDKDCDIIPIFAVQNME